MDASARKCLQTAAGLMLFLKHRDLHAGLSQDVTTFQSA
jgi:hypothetical protein